MSQPRYEKFIYVKIMKNAPTYVLIICDRLSVVWTSNGFCVGCLERFISCESVKVVIGNYRVKCHRAFVSTTFEKIRNLPFKGKDRQQMQLINKAMNFSAQVKNLAILEDCFLFKYE